MDLAYQRGEETEFFAPGDHAGTPYRTLPARKKPLVQLGSDYAAVHLCFARDAGIVRDRSTCCSASLIIGQLSTSGRR